jgi:hypothetical protein
VDAAAGPPWFAATLGAAAAPGGVVEPGCSVWPKAMVEPRESGIAKIIA